MAKRQLSPAALIERRELLGISLEDGELDGSRLRARRQKTGQTLTVFAVRVGLSESQLRNLELGNKQPSPEALNRIANELGIDPAELLAGTASSAA